MTSPLEITDDDSKAAKEFSRLKGDDCLCQRTQPGTPVGEHIYSSCGCDVYEAFVAGIQYRKLQGARAVIQLLEETTEVFSGDYQKSTNENIAEWLREKIGVK